MLKNKAVIAVILVLLAGAIAYNVHFFYKRMHPSSSPAAIPQKPAHTPPAPTSHPAIAATPAKAASPQGEEEKKQPLLKEALSLVQHKRMLKGDKWGRNPFFTPEELRQIAILNGETPEDKKKKKVEKIPVILSGIIQVEHEKMAIINNRVMLEGQEIGKIKLLKVLPAAVWVTVDNVRRWVPLPQSQIALMVQQNTLSKPHDVVKKEKEK